MKIVSLFALLCGITVFAQPAGWLIEDLKEGSHYVVIRLKKEVGIWNNAKGDYTVVPHKGHIFHFKELQLLLDVYPKEERVDVYHYYEKTMQKIDGVNDSTFLRFGHILNAQWDEKLTIGTYEADYFFSTDGIMVTHDPKSPYNTWYGRHSFFSFSFNENFLLVTLAHYNCYGEPRVAIKSAQYPKMDSISLSGDVVYYPKDCKEVNNSGIFNLKTGQWDVPPHYTAINEWQGIYGAYFWPNYGENYKEENKDLKDWSIVYDFYKKEKKTIVPTEFIRRKKFAFPLELWPFEGEKVWYDPDSIYIYHETKKGVGLYQVALSGKNTKDGYRSARYSSEGRFEVEELLEPKYESIFISGNVDLSESPNRSKNLYVMASKGDNIFDLLFFNELRTYPGYWKIDTLIEDVPIHKSIQLLDVYFWESDTNLLKHEEPIALIDDKPYIRYCPLNGETFGHEYVRWVATDYSEISGSRNYRTLLREDQLYVVTANEFEKEGLTASVKSIANPLHDSLDNEGNVLYYAPDPGKYSSGIFDGKTNEWTLAPNNIMVYPTFDGYVIEAPETNDYGQLINAYFALQGADGTYEFQNIKWSKFKEYAYDKYKIEGYTVNQLEYIGNPEDRKCYFYTSEGVGIASFYYYTSKILVHPKEMAKHGPNGTSIYVEDDTVFIKMNGSMDRFVQEVEMAMPLDSSVRVAISGEYTPRKRYKDRYSRNREDINYYADPSVNLILMNTERSEAGHLSVYKSQFGFAYDTLTWYILPDTQTIFKGNQISCYDFITYNRDWQFEFATWDNRFVYMMDIVADDERETYRSIVYPLSDSIDLDGNTVYYPPDLGYCSSGVYDVQNHDWIVKPEYMAVQWMMNDIFLLNAPVRTEDEGLLYASAYSIQKGKKIIPFKSSIHVRGWQSRKKSLPYYNIGKINDSLVYINDYQMEKGEEALESIEYPMDDSLDFEGNVVYSEIEPGRYESGVFNVLTEEWQVPAENYKVYLFSDAFVVSKPSLCEDDLLCGFSYSVYDLSGNLLAEGVNGKNLPEKYSAALRN